MENDQEKPLFDTQAIKTALRDRKKRWDIFKTLIFYIAIYALFLFISDYFNINTETVQEKFSGLGMYLVPAFIGIQLVASLTPLPDLPFIAVGILFFPPSIAFALIWIGMWLGTLINFKIARSLGRDWVQSHYPQTADWIDRFTGRYWFETIVIGRSFMLVTFDLLAYAAGISSLSFTRFAFASIFGLIPVALNAILIGLAVTAGNLGKTAVYGLATAVLAVLIGLFTRGFKQRWEKSSSITT